MFLTKKQNLEQMKESKTEGQNKATRKAAKKALEQSLTAKLVEAVKSLGHDAEKIGEDLILVSKFVAKKISKRVNGGANDVDKKAAATSSKDQVETPQKPAKEKKSSGKVERKTKDEEAQNVKTAVQADAKTVVKAKSQVADPAKKALDKKVSVKKSPQKKALPVLKPIATSVKVNVNPFKDETEPTTAPSEIKRSNPVVKSTKVKAPVKKTEPASDPETEHIN